jgi:hypothetical protein
MKIQSKLTSLICLTSMVTGPFVFAEETVTITPEIARCAPFEGFVPDVEGPCVFPGPLEEPISIDDTVVDSDSDAVVSEEGGQVEENEVVDSGDAVKTPEAEIAGPCPRDPTDADGGDGVPIEWVKRGGGDEEVSILYSATGGPDRHNRSGTPEGVSILYSATGGPQPVLDKGAEANPLVRELGQEDKAAAIESKASAAAPQAMGEKKEPVALIKKGRVYLR